MNKTNLWVDMGIFAAFLVAANPALTGIALHEWFSIAFVGTLIVHLLLHWKWVVTVGATFFRKLFHFSRLQFLVDVLLFTAFTAVTLSGVMISKNVVNFLGITLASNPTWKLVHSLSANGVLLLVGLHFALHWNWVVRMVKRYLISPVRLALKPHQRRTGLSVGTSKE